MPSSCLVYWSYIYESNVYNHLFQGVIKKGFYDYIKILDKYEEYYFNSPVDDCEGAEFTIREIKFVENPIFISYFLDLSQDRGDN